VKFGIFALPTYFAETDGSINDFYQRILSLLEDSERLGFDLAWANEHHFHPYGGMIPFPPVLLAAVAARTTRIRLGTSVTLPPLYHPLHVAESYAMLDQISGGRLEFGVGRGFVKYDYDTFGVPVEEAQERLLESLDVILTAWQRQPFSHHGKYFDFDDVSVLPAPLQRPHPPVWMACTSNPEGFAYAGSRGFNLLTVSHVFPLDKLAGLIRIYRDAGANAGCDPAKLQASTHFQVLCLENRDEAVREGIQAIRRYDQLNKAARLQGSATLLGRPERDPPEQILEEGRVCLGTPDDCVRILSQAEQVLNLDEVDCTFYFGGIDYATARRSLELFAAEVMPRLTTRRAVPAAP
jgi:alkanesulfonate monooxygenase SsuD/methylene tetrahydromethanopterin reductase-like flavin-dependent oxidoreductase (luciferase family)